MESQYLKRCLGSCLKKGLAEVVEHRPADPIEYLAHWIYNYRRILHEEKKRMLERTELEQEREAALVEVEILRKMKEEELMIQRKLEEQCQVIIALSRLSSVGSYEQELLQIKLETVAKICGLLGGLGVITNHCLQLLRCDTCDAKEGNKNVCVISVLKAAGNQ
uniref:DPY30 domain-containing protein 1 n=1 Tax=Falco tinnunculus TaxID=100819 RepID=A0A8C4UHQ3_FALTI